MTRSRFTALLLVTGLCATAPARAALYDELGGEAGMNQIVASAAERFRTDPRIGPTFDDTNMERFKRLLSAQLCQLSGGGCTYTGRDMASAHRALILNDAQFNAVAEDLQAAMASTGVPYRVQNRLLALLAPMERDVVTQ